MDESIKETEWWWIDYLENELDPALDKDLQMLLEHSAEDRDSFENFRIIKQWVKDSDPAAISEKELEYRLDRVRRNVMAKVSLDPADKSERIQETIR